MDATPLHNLRRTSFVAPVAAFLLLAATSVAAAADAPAGIPFGVNMEAALAKAQLQPRVTVVVFSAQWCPWCTRMQTGAFADPRILALAARFHWVKIDIDLDPEVAMRYGVRGVPHTVLLNVRGQPLASRAGYMTAEVLLPMLQEFVDKAAAQGEGEDIVTAVEAVKKLAAGGPRPADMTATLTAAVRILARPDRAARAELIEGLRGVGADAWPTLMSLMSSDRLDVRAAAHGALASVTLAELPFDAFAKPGVRLKQLAAWRTWMDANYAPGKLSPVPAPLPPRKDDVPNVAPQNRPQPLEPARPDAPAAAPKQPVEQPPAERPPQPREKPPLRPLPEPGPIVPSDQA